VFFLFISVIICTQNDSYYTLLLTNTIGIPLSHMALSDYRWGGVCSALVQKYVCFYARGMEATWWGHCITRDDDGGARMM
jgi:hypothetical protein